MLGRETKTVPFFFQEKNFGFASCLMPPGPTRFPRPNRPRRSPLRSPPNQKPPLLASLVGLFWLYLDPSLDRLAPTAGTGRLSWLATAFGLLAEPHCEFLYKASVVRGPLSPRYARGPALRDSSLPSLRSSLVVAFGHQAASATLRVESAPRQNDDNVFYSFSISSPLFCLSL